MAEVAERPSLILSFEELVHLTGYRQPAAQLNNLKAQGFHRARRNALGSVVLERAHYEAVCSDPKLATAAAHSHCFDGAAIALFQRQDRGV